MKTTHQHDPSAPPDLRSVHEVARQVASDMANGNFANARSRILQHDQSAAVAVLALRYSEYPTPGDNDRMLRLLGVPENVWGWYMDGDD